MTLLQSRSGSGRRTRRWLACAAACVLSVWCAVAAQAQGLPPELQQAWKATRLPSSSLALHVQEVGGPALMSINASEPRSPASVMKMVTTWSALSGLGPDYRWRTAFYARDGGRIDELGTLSGPVYLKAGGDPFMTVEELWGLLRQLRLRGIKNLGEVVVDRSIFGAVATDPGEFDGAADRPYNASPDAMMVGLGAVRLVFHPDQQARRWIPIVDPPVHGVRIEGEVKWSNVRCPGSPSVGTRVAPAGKNIVVHVSGTAAGSCGEFSVYRLAQSQPDYFSALFQMLWRELGGTLAKGLRPGKVPSGAS